MNTVAPQTGRDARTPSSLALLSRFTGMVAATQGKSTAPDGPPRAPLYWWYSYQDTVISRSVKHKWEPRFDDGLNRSDPRGTPRPYVCAVTDTAGELPGGAAAGVLRPVKSQKYSIATYSLPAGCPGDSGACTAARYTHVARESSNRQNAAPTLALKKAGHLTTSRSYSSVAAGPVWPTCPLALHS